MTVMSFGRISTDDRAAVENDQPVGDLVDVGEIVLDVDAGAPGFLDPSDEVEDLAHLGDGERHRRLVENDEVGIVVHGAADRDALALAAGEIRDRRIDGDADAAKADSPGQDILGDLLLLLDVDEAEAVGDLAADEEVPPERLFLGKRTILVDGLDGEIVGHADGIVRELDFLVANEDAAGGRREDAGHHLDQGRLAGAVVADQPDDLVLADREVDVLQSVDRPEELLHALEANDRPAVLRDHLRFGRVCNVRHHSPLTLMPAMASASAWRRSAWKAPRASSASPRFIASKMARWRGMK